MKKRQLNIFLIVYIIVLLIILIPAKTVSYQIDVVYNDQENYIDIEPYEVEETYKSLEPYTSTEIYTDTIPISRDVEYEEEQLYYEKMAENNCDDDADCFCQKASMVGGIMTCTECACQRTQTVTKYRKEVEYEEVTKTRPVTKYNEVTKTRTITRYKDVNKTRTIAKVRQETIRKSVNWLFGFNVPWKIF